MTDVTLGISKYYLFFISCLFGYVLCARVLSAYIPARLKKASDFITHGYNPPWSCWELISGPLEEQPMYLSTESSLSPFHLAFIMVAQ